MYTTLNTCIPLNLKYCKLKMRAIFTKPVNSRKLILVEKGFKDCFFPIENGTKQIQYFTNIQFPKYDFRNNRSCLPPWEFCLLVSLWGQVQQSLIKLSYSIIVTVPEKIYVICLETETSSIWMNWDYFVGRNFFPILVSLIYMHMSINSEGFFQTHTVVLKNVKS